jgi:peptidoglycan/xylan/chitin deacetylase (PgdA/CDA1 family)|tara:strand:+ start:3967 stop:4671 length:705 start_codon:yes stop_codon:yes gene_type:complete
MKNICLTFDDGLKSHYEFVRPLLKNNGLKGTFFICTVNPWGGHPLREELMSIGELKQMQLDGFELGNHTHSHLNLTTLKDERVTSEICKVNDFFKKHSLNLPTSFCYPGYHASIKVSKILKKLNFTHARTGYVYDHHPWERSKEVERPKVSYHPLSSDSSLLIKSTGIVNDIYKFEDFKKDVEEAPDDSYCVFTFHGFKSKDGADELIKIVNYIKENDFPTFNLSELPAETSYE